MSVRGYADWKPKPDAAHWIVATRDVLDAYKAYWPLSVRQIFYRLVADHGYDKTEASYNRLTGIISRARRAGFLPWDAVRDGGLGRTIPPRYFDSQQDFEDTIRRAAKTMKLNRQKGQEAEIELWCEAGGMVPILEGIAEPYSCRVNTGGGYDSVTAKHRLAERVRDRAEDDLKTVILHVGDFDASGEDMANVLRADVLSMVAHQILLNGEFGPDWIQAERDSDEAWSREAIRWALDFLDIERVALTGQQVIDRGVETAPPKKSDSRTAEFVKRNQWVANTLGTTQITAQLEALTPPELGTLIQDAIEDRLDMSIYQDVLIEEQQVRDDLIDRLDR